MKICIIEECQKKHHAKGYCVSHYNKLVLTETKTCSVQNCNTLVKGSNMCSKHYTRLRRHGSPHKTSRIRNMFSLTEFIKTGQEEILDYVFETRTQWSIAVKLYYGDICSICGWNETTCDANHIISVRTGGEEYYLKWRSIMSKSSCNKA